MTKSYFKFIIYFLGEVKRHICKSYATFKLKQRYLRLFLEEDVQIKKPEKLILGENITIQKGTILHCGGMKWSNFKGHIKIGDDSIISPNCIFYGAGGIEIGKRFDCGPSVMIFSSRTDYSTKHRGKDIQHSFGKVVIGDDVTLFANVILNMDIKIGNGSVIGGSSVVLCDIPSNEFWAGIPAKFIKKVRR